MDFDVPTTVKLASYVGAGFCIGLGAIGAALGEGYTAGLANEGNSQDPTKSGEIVKNMLVGQAVAESAGIFSLVIAILLLFLDVGAATMVKAAAISEPIKPPPITRKRFSSSAHFRNRK